MVGNYGIPEYQGYLRDDCVTIAEALKGGGCAEFLAEDSASPEPFRYDIPTADGRPMRIGNTAAVAPGPDDTFQSYDLPWANASNTPFRLFKHWVHEGGIGTPLVASWPRVIERAGIVHQPVHVIDILPTLLEATGVPLPERRAGRPVTSVEGESLLPLLSGAPWTRDRPIFFEHEGNRVRNTATLLRRASTAFCTTGGGCCRG